jgi:hypothetical protein
MACLDMYKDDGVGRREPIVLVNLASLFRSEISPSDSEISISTI